MANLERFVDAQAEVYPRVLAELRAGRKQTHWVWFIFPQLAGLGTSEMSRRYAIADLVEARAYLRHPVLAPRLVECVETVISHWIVRCPAQILGSVDAMKLRSCLTLFATADVRAPFITALSYLYGGEPCENTKALLYGSSE